MVLAGSMPTDNGPGYISKRFNLLCSMGSVTIVTIRPGDKWRRIGLRVDVADVELLAARARKAVQVC